MLKDLDERQNKRPNSNELIENTSAHAPSRKKTLPLTIIALVIVNIVGIYVWQLTSENSSLKDDLERLAPSVNKSSTASVNPPQVKNAKTNIDTELSEIIETQNADEITIAKQAVQSKPVIKTGPAIKSTPVIKNNTLKSAGEEQKTLSTSTKHLPNKNDKPSVDKPSVDKYAVDKAAMGASVSAPAPTDHATSRSGDIEGHSHSNLSQHPHPHPQDKSGTGEKANTNNNVAPRKNSEKTISSMSVSRKKLTTSQLVQHKLTAAEQALANNQVNSAEELFEEVLLLDRNHKSARQQLAALWFGRQSYQAATNLLSQGISLSPNDSDFRLMKARIHLQANQPEQAYRTLLVLSDYSVEPAAVEYTAMLGNLAQQLGHHQQAVLSYRELTALQPNVGRWWLGLAIAYDRLEKYKYAVNAYNKAMLQVDLSKNSTDFALARISVLGE